MEVAWEEAWDSKKVIQIAALDLLERLLWIEEKAAFTYNDLMDGEKNIWREAVESVESLGVIGVKRIFDEEGAETSVADGKITKIFSADDNDLTVNEPEMGFAMGAHVGANLKFYFEFDLATEKSLEGAAFYETGIVTKIEVLDDGSARIYTENNSVYLLEGTVHMQKKLESSMQATENVEGLLDRIRKNLPKWLGGK